MKRPRVSARFSPAEFFALGFVVFAGCAQPPTPEAKKKAERPAAVVVERLSAQPFHSEQSFSGEVWAVSQAALTVGEAGRVRRVYVAEGERVVEGQLLLELEDGLARAELGRARATRKSVEVQARQASDEATRFLALNQQQLATELQTQLEASQAKSLLADQTGAEANVAVMSQRVQRHRITAPFAGTVARRRVDPGDWLSPGEPALELLTESQVEVLVRVPPALLELGQEGGAVILQSHGRRTPAHVTRSVPALDRQTRTALFRVSPDQRPEWLRPGSSVQVVFATLRKDGHTVPRDALVYGLAGVRVIRKTADRADPVPVEVLETAGDLALVRASELAVGDELIVRGNERLRPGQLVTLQSAVSGYRPAASGQTDSRAQ